MAEYIAKLQQGLEQRDLKTLEEGLVNCYDAFYHIVLKGANRKEEHEFGRNLSEVYSRHRELEEDGQFSKYMGQIRTFINLTDIILQSEIPLDVLQTIGNGGPEATILRALYEKDIQSEITTKLIASTGLNNNTFYRAILHLESYQLIRTERFGRCAWRKLTPRGERALLNKRF